MQFSYTIYRMAANNCQWCHANLSDIPLLNKGEFCLHSDITGKEFFDFLKKTVIDVIYYFKMPGQHPSEYIHRPCFKSFRHQSVVGKTKGFNTDIPGLFPFQPFNIN